MQRHANLSLARFAAAAFAVAGATWAQDVYTPFLAPASEEGTAAIEGFELREGLSIELFAAEPMLANPVCLYVDEVGAVYIGETFRHYAGVTDIREHMGWLDDDLASRTVEDRLAMFKKHEGEEGYATYALEHERVRKIVDADGDGRADRSTVFADGFNAPSAGIGAGLLARRGDVYYTCIPDLWLLRDSDSDGVADERRVLSSGYGVNVALLGHDLHGLRIGPDGRLYFSCGDRGFHVETENGTLAHPHAGAVLRCELDGTNLEVFHSGLRNPQELVFDELGNLFTGDNNSDGGDQARWVNVVQGGESGWRYAYQWITSPVPRGPWNADKLWHPLHEGQAAYIVPPIANLAHGPSGLTYYPGTGLGPAYDGTFFLCDFRGAPSYSGVHAFRTTPRGAFYELGEVERLIWNVLVTDIDFGPDGSLYLTDWVQGWNKTGKGRVYRIFDAAESDSALVRETRRLLATGLRGLAIEELEELLSHPDQRVRQEAQFELVDRGRAGHDVLDRSARLSTSLYARLHGLWGLGMAHRLHGVTLETVLELTKDDEDEVRAQAWSVLGDTRQAAAAELVTDALTDAAARVRYFAAQAAGRIGVPGAVPALAVLLRDVGATDPNLRHAAVMGLVGSADAAALAELAHDANADARMGALLVLRRHGEASIADFLADPERRLVLEAARAIYDVPIEAADDALRALAHEPATSEPALVRRVLNALGHARSAETAATLATFVLRADLELALREEALDILTTWETPPTRDRVTGVYRPLETLEAPYLADLATDLLASGIADAPESVVRRFLAFAAECDAVDVSSEIAAWVTDEERSVDVRVDALDTLADLRGSELPRCVDASFASTEGRLRAAALRALEGLSVEQALQRVPDILQRGEYAERRAAYGLLQRLAGEQAEPLLGDELGLLGVGLVPAELALDLVLAAEATTGLEGRLTARTRARQEFDPDLTPYLDGLFGGDAEKGRAIFERVDLSCVRCHARGADDAPQIGPDLSGVSQRLTRLQVLESIVTPNRRTTPGYKGTILFLAEGGHVAGRIVEETDEFVRVIDADGRVSGVPKDAIEERRADVSAMPEGLADGISRLEMRALLAYLAEL